MIPQHYTDTARSIATAAALSLLIAATAFAQVPQTMSFQGELGSGIGANSTQSLTFRIYTTSTGGSALRSGTAGGDVDGTVLNPTVDALQGNAVSSTASRDAQFLKWNGGASQWSPANVNELPAGAVVQTLSATPPPGYTYTGVSSSFITE